MTGEPALYEHILHDDSTHAALTVNMAQRSPHSINPLLYGKYCEHLGWNIYNGMEARILHNPTFGKWRFGVTDRVFDGGSKDLHDLDHIEQSVRAYAQRFAWPDADQVLQSHKDGLAFGWFRAGSQDAVRLSPDVGPHGARAQRVEVIAAGAEQPQGIAQWVSLPLHRTRGYQFRIVGRATAPTDVILSIAPLDAAGAVGPELARRTLPLAPKWSTLSGFIAIPAEAEVPAAGLFRVALTTTGPANVVLNRVLLYPDDHINGADPDVIRFLRAARLPLLRWPGGNFVSGYRWQEGIGPEDSRPTAPNPAWGGLEYQLFGTDEFIAFCHAVGSPEEAAARVEYCNGSRDTPMGGLRVLHVRGVDPYNVQYWEIGNEIYGRWQVGWTTPGGNVDRYRRFREAMLAADPTITILGCGVPGGAAQGWNQHRPTHARLRDAILHFDHRRFALRALHGGATLLTAPGWPSVGTGQARCRGAGRSEGWFSPHSQLLLHTLHPPRPGCPRLGYVSTLPTRQCSRQRYWYGRYPVDSLVSLKVGAWVPPVD